jgi:hypothetical protein
VTRHTTSIRPLPALLLAATLSLVAPALAADPAPVTDAGVPGPASAPATDAALEAMLPRLLKPGYRSWESQADFWKRLGLEQPQEVVLRAARQRAKTGHVLAQLQQAYALSPSAARHFLHGLLSATPEMGSWSIPNEQLASALERYVQAAREAPGHLAVLASMVLDANEAPGHTERFLEALELSPTPADTALQLVKGGRPLYNWEGALAAYAVSRQPDLLPRALDTLGLHGYGTEAKLFYYAAWKHLRTQGSGAAPSPALGERVLRGLMEAELPTLALEVLQQLPEAQRQAMLAGKWSLRERIVRSTSEREWEEEHAPSDLRVDLAAVFLVSGDAQGARPWFEASRAAPPTLDADPSGSSCVTAMHRAILTFHLAPEPGADPFELMRLDAMCSRGLRFPFQVLYLERIRGPYPEAARRLLHWELTSRDDDARDYPVLIPERLGFLAPARQAFVAADTVRRKRLEALFAALPAAPPAQGAMTPDPVALRIQGMLGMPAMNPFTERPLAEAPKPTRSSNLWRPINAEKLELPPGFRPVRAEARGKHMRAVALSQRLDPVGEISGGGYWLLESPDGGRTWASHLYLGLRQYRPYAVLAHSKMPLLVGDTLRLEVKVRELDEKSITFPPIRLAVKRERSGLFVEAPLSTLRQDSDGDGLTDLVEDRLLLDARAPDTDGDGQRDGEDALPQVPASGGTMEGAEAQVMAAVFSWLNQDTSGPQGLEVGLPEPGQPAQPLRLPKGATLESSLDVLFLEADRHLMRGVPMPERTLVLSEAELELAEKRFGQFYAMTLELTLNTAKDQALISWSQRWRGGRLLARKGKEGRWVIESLGSWIT